MGCVSTILQMLKLPDGTVKVLVEGHQRAKVNRIEDGESHFNANVTPLEPPTAGADADVLASEVEALRRAPDDQDLETALRDVRAEQAAAAAVGKP